MGVLNVTPDSFSDGGQFTDCDSAVRHALELVEQGAEIIDVGGESTRPGSAPVPEAEELRRVIPVIEKLRPLTDAFISIDTAKAEVARRALQAGADIINDVTALRGDPRMRSVAAEHDCGVVLMHMRGTPRTMQEAPVYRDVVAEVGEMLRQAVAEAVKEGIEAMRIAVDPGIGFGKTPEHNRALLAGLGDFTALRRPLLVGVSRKSFLAWAVGEPAIGSRHWPGVALTAFCRELGARLFRVHEPRPHFEALRMTEAILGETRRPTDD